LALGPICLGYTKPPCLMIKPQGTVPVKFQTRTKEPHIREMLPYVTEWCSGAGFRSNSSRANNEIGPATGRSPAGGPILRLSRLESGRSTTGPRSPDRGSEALQSNLNLVAVKPLGKKIILVLVLVPCCFVPVFGQSWPPRTPVNGPGSTHWCRTHLQVAP
jgi:hypothetical protein